ncbi:Bug family tripartite tricarboxylate transporter substrate binding protein [Paracraurococcus ruber]|nr:tripartite tricarboxylate transporter substrate binding protein [Paracraurococcus ruber]
MRLTRRRLLAAAPLAAVPLAAAPLALPARAQGQWPDRPVRFIVGFAPGGPTDVLARRAAQGFQEILGQPVVVENRPGAAGNLGSELVARAPADGHTVLVANSGQVVINPHTYERMSFDPMRDLVPVSAMITNPFLFCVNSQLGVTTHAQLMEWLQRQPDSVKYASTGAGGITHVVTEMWRARTRANVEPVHFRGTAAAIPDVLANRTPLFFDGVQMLGQHVRSGALRAMMLTNATRSAVMPEVPTSAEAGIPDYNVQSWFAMYAPRGTPRPVVDRLAAVNRQVMGAAKMRETFAAENIECIPGSPEELGTLTQRYFAMFGEAVRAGNIRADA